jgi:para-aminobenzoate synthetase/4-amino-4-deoxychorismate lyase
MDDRHAGSLESAAAVGRSWRKCLSQAIDGKERTGSVTMAGSVPGGGSFRLIETMKWQAGAGYWLLDRHLARLAASAAHFGFACDVGAVRAGLVDLAARLGSGTHRVRLLLAADGGIALGHDAIEAAVSPRMLRLAWATRAVEPDDPFLRHKTTRRDLYEAELARARDAGQADEVLFVNRRGEATEGSWTNLFVEIAGRLCTPPISSGLLPGTFRQSLLDDPAAGVSEAVLRPEDVRRADRLFLGNSVRGLMAAELIDGVHA